jgi:hypothetical protein
MPTITYTLQAIWDDVQTTSIQFDISTFGEGDKFANALAGDFSATDGTVETITAVETVEIDRGRDDNLEDFGMGECAVVITDNAGRYNPVNTASPLAAKIRPLRQVRVQATVSGVTRTIFRGYIRTIDHNANAGVARTTFRCADLFLPLSKARPAVTNVGRDTTTGEAIGQVLSAAGWSNAALTSLEAGDLVPSPGVGNASGANTALDIISGLLQTERGDFYIKGDGTVCFSQRYSRATKTSSATLTNVGTTAVATSDIERVRNRATITATRFDPDVTAEASDGNSIATYGQVDFSNISSPYIYDGTQAINLAQWLVSQRKTPLSPMRSLEVTINGNAALASTVLGIEISDKITVTNTAIGQTSQQFFVEGVRHRIAGGRHDVSLTLLPITNPVLVLDDASAGKLDSAILAY